MARLVEKPRQLCRGHFLFRIQYEGGNVLPGQFVNIRAWKGLDPLLRRPFSVFSQEGDMLEIIVKVVGRGTKILTTLEPGEIDMLGPMGKGFTLAEKSSVLLAGGGVGNAPLYHLAKHLKARGSTLFYLYGSRSSDCIYLKDEFVSICDEILFTTDDGSLGRTGTVTDIAREVLASHQFSIIYTCGPTAMMNSLTAASGDTPIEVSVENYFGCGIGLCMGCTVDTADGLKRACVDGPVFDGKKINWDSFGMR
jgi:dihydroorotate dehydrogenase electron transfer subunit